MKKQVFDQAFKQMAVELSYAKGSVKIAATEMGIDPGRTDTPYMTNYQSKATSSDLEPKLLFPVDSRGVLVGSLPGSML